MARVAATAWIVIAKSTSSVTGARSVNGACLRWRARGTSSRIMRHATAGATLFAAWRLTASFTITVATPSPSRSFASAARAESPLTRATGTPCTPASPALRPSSPAGFPFSRTS